MFLHNLCCLNSPNNQHWNWCFFYLQIMTHNKETDAKKCLNYQTALPYQTYKNTGICYIGYIAIKRNQ